MQGQFQVVCTIKLWYQFEILTAYFMYMYMGKPKTCLELGGKDNLVIIFYYANISLSLMFSDIPYNRKLNVRSNDLSHTAIK